MSEREDLIAALERAEAALTDPAFRIALDAEPPETGGPARTKVRRSLTRIMFARLDLVSAQINDVAEALERESATIESGIEALDEALKHLNAVKPVLDGITQFLKVVGKIVTLF